MTSPRPLTSEDLFRFKVVSDPRAAPDGSRIAWVETTIDQDGDMYRSSIVVARSDGKGAVHLTAGTHRDSAPRWSPDGTTILFESNRPPNELPPDEVPSDRDKAGGNGKASSPGTDGSPSRVTQLWTIRLDGGEAIQLTAHPRGASDACWSPDGRHVVFAGAADGDGAVPPVRAGAVADERIVGQLHYRADGRGFIERVSHLWTIRISDRHVRQLTSGDAGAADPAWSPDGARIAFVSNRSPDRKRLWNRRAIHLVEVDSGEVTSLTPDAGAFGTPRWSPGGDRLAFIGHEDGAAGGALNDRIWTVRPNGSDLRGHTADWDVSVETTAMSDLAAASQGGPAWLDEGHILTLAADRGAVRVFRVDLAGGTPVPLTHGPHAISGFAVAGDRLVVVHGSIDCPATLRSSTLDGQGDRLVADPNEALMSELALSAPVDLTWTSADGLEIQGWLLAPAGFDATRGVRHPLIVQIHGGPHSMYGYAMFHEMHLMAARGYAVLFTNPRGSGGYGEAFTGSTRGRWGEADMPDVMAAVDDVATLPWIDADRIGITGGSYGGYLTNWIIGHDTRFRAAVTQRCVSNFHSFFGTSDIGSTFGAFEFDGVPWRDAEKLLRYSPISYVEAIATPLLILHSERDYRCPIEQAEQMYTALAYLGKEVGFVRFPEEGHELSRSGTPSRRIARLHHLIGWFDSHL